MQFTALESANLLASTEENITSWYKTRNLPAAEINDHLYLNFIEVWEWAISNEQKLSNAYLAHLKARKAKNPLLQELPPTTLLEAFKKGGSKYLETPLTDKHALALAISQDLTENFSRANPKMEEGPPSTSTSLAALLACRPNLGLNLLMDERKPKIAIPAPRYPLLLPALQPKNTPPILDTARLYIYFLKTPLDFNQSAREEPRERPHYHIHTLVFLLSQTITIHLTLLLELTLLLQEQPQLLAPTSSLITFSETLATYTC